MAKDKPLPWIKIPSKYSDLQRTIETLQDCVDFRMQEAEAGGEPVAEAEREFIESTIDHLRALADRQVGL